MSYKSADKVLPKELMEEIQKYIQGEYIYVPSTTSSKKGWGVKSGIREELTSRNNKIRKEGRIDKIITQHSGSRTYHFDYSEWYFYVENMVKYRLKVIS